MLKSLSLLVVVAAVPMALRASSNYPQGAGCLECLLREFQLQRFADVRRLAQLSRDQLAEVILSNLLCDRCWSVRKQDLPNIFGCMSWVSRVQNDCEYILPDAVATTGHRLVRVLACLDEALSLGALSCLLKIPDNSSQAFTP